MTFAVFMPLTDVRSRGPDDEVAHAYGRPARAANVSGAPSARSHSGRVVLPRDRMGSRHLGGSRTPMERRPYRALRRPHALRPRVGTAFHRRPHARRLTATRLCRRGGSQHRRSGRLVRQIYDAQADSCQPDGTSFHLGARDWSPSHQKASVPNWTD